MSPAKKQTPKPSPEQVEMARAVFTAMFAGPLAERILDDEKVMRRAVLRSLQAAAIFEEVAA